MYFTELYCTATCCAVQVCHNIVTDIPYQEYDHLLRCTVEH